VIGFASGFKARTACVAQCPGHSDLPSIIQ
jgi:hypothetical protein